MIFKEETPLYAYEIVRENGENVMYINYLKAPYVPNIAESREVMQRTIDNLKEEQNITRIVYVQQRNYSHDFTQVQQLIEIAQLHQRLTKQENILNIQTLNNIGGNTEQVHAYLNWLINELLSQDPIQTYREIKNALLEQKLQHTTNNTYYNLLEKLQQEIEQLSIITTTKQHLEEYPQESREPYKKIFRADIMPNFTFTRMKATLPEKAKILQQYWIAEGEDKSLVTILQQENKTKPTYHLIPPEYNLEEEQHLLLNLARNVLIEHRPTKEEFNDPERTRQVFHNIARDLLNELATNKGINLPYKELTKLATILVRHTIGFGILEVLLKDEQLQDIVVNAPIAINPIYAKHNDYGECETNIIPSKEDADSWAAKFRMTSGRALDEANPILDTNIELKEASARVAIIQEPLSAEGLAYALRRHRNKPWTLPLFIKNKMINSLGAGLLSFIIDGARTALVAGTRSSGKTSLLGSLLLEIQPQHRIITIEDTLELPVNAMRKLHYDILSMKVRSALMGETTEVSAEEGIRSSLRLGDSSLIIGEIRSSEAKALYEAMRVGALANVVAGTIHGGTPYSVFDRVVNDLEVPVTSFKATDIIIIVNPIRSADGNTSWRRVLQITEVRKHWEKDPQKEGGFVDLMKYNVKTDQLEPTDALINGDSEILKEIAANVKEWAGNWDAVWENILLRQDIKHTLVETATKEKKPELLEAEFYNKAQNAFHNITKKITEEEGTTKKELIYGEWKNWLEKEIEH